MQTPFRVLADPDREVYHRYGLHRALFRVQRTAVVIIDKQGVMRYFKTTANATAWLQEAPRLLGAVRQLHLPQ
jgi:alkyl hydroperoxide reductase subunit AhpC